MTFSTPMFAAIWIPPLRSGRLLLFGCSMLLATLWLGRSSVIALEPIPDKLVVLTFDDSIKSHYTVARPILKKYNFGATFFITEGFDFKDNKQDYMTWDEIAHLHEEGFEIGNHTRDHMSVTDDNVEQLAEQVRAINEQCRKRNIPEPVSFAYPGNSISLKALPELTKLGIRFARRGGLPEYPYDKGRGVAYEPGLDHPLLIPSAGDARPDWRLDDFIQAVEQARHGRIAVLQFHGVPDTAHAWVNTPHEKFEAYMRYLAAKSYRVIALRDLADYIDPRVIPGDPDGAIKDRQRRIAAEKSLDDSRPPANDQELAYWLKNMRAHNYALPEVCRATGLSTEEAQRAWDRLDIDSSATPVYGLDPPLVLPYPGGRHPRIGFLEGAIRPQRETKFSIFTPWEGGGYIVADFPEAIWVEHDAGRELLYLAHTHVDTMWNRQGIELEPMEWERLDGGVLRIERQFPNGVAFGAKVWPRKGAVITDLWIRNESDEVLRGLLVQNCIMLKAARGFEDMTNDNKLIEHPFVACGNEAQNRWIISAWQRCVRPWANPPCPCMHSDPQFPDCAPGETKHLRGWTSFYEGVDIDGELRRIAALNWEQDEL